MFIALWKTDYIYLNQLVALWIFYRTDTFPGTLSSICKGRRHQVKNRTAAARRDRFHPTILGNTSRGAARNGLFPR
jgi:hypothetical protein